MKRFIALFVLYVLAVLPASCAFCTESVEINAQNFPDEKFRAYVSDELDTDKNGSLSEEEIAAVADINVSGQGISSLKGIEYFTALEYLYCDNNQLTALDVSNNPALEYLNCYSNALTALDVSNNTELTDLQCYSNDLTALDVSSSTALKYLECDNNQLTALDVSKNTKLTHLSCYNNQLTALDVSSSTALEYLTCYSNQLTALDVSSNTALTYLDCDSNQLTALDVSKNTALEDLYCHSNQLTSLDVSKNTALDYLFCFDNKLTELDVSSNTALTRLRCYGNQLTALDVSKNTALEYLICNGQNTSGSNIIYTGDATYPYEHIFSWDISADKIANISDVAAKDSSDAAITVSYADGTARFASFPSKVTYNYKTSYEDKVMDVTLSDFSLFIEINGTIFPDEKFRAYISNDLDTDNDGYLSIKAATSIDVSGQGISSLKGIEYFTALEYLYCDNNQLTALDVSNNTELTYLNCYSNALTALDVSNNTKLTYLTCYSNQLTALDLNSNTALTSLYCGNNQIAALDLSNNAALQSLQCNNNQLSELDLRNCPSLTPNSITADSNVRIIHGNMDGLPSFTSHSLILSGQLGLDFYANVPASTNTEGAYTDFTVNSKTGSPEMFSNAEKAGDDYRFTCYINSVQMADTITAMFCYSNDTRNMAAVQDCRVTDYLDAIISSTDLSAKSPDLVALAEAIKDYGHYVQIPLSRYNSWDIGTDHAEIECVNKNIDSDSADIKAKLEAYALSKDIEGSGIESLMFDLELESETTLNIYLTPGNETGNITAYITDSDNEFDGTKNMAVYDPQNNRYVITIGGISAHKLGKVYSVRITTGKGENFPVKISALSYADAVMQAENDGENIDDDLKRAVISLYKYYAATMKYRGEPLTE